MSPSGADSAAATARVSGSGGVAGNERLTAGTAVVLLVLLAVEGVTIAFIGPLLLIHVFVGMLLLGPVALKIGSTGYRFLRYYQNAQPYRRKGPPRPIMRVLGPLLIAASLLVLGSGVALIWPHAHIRPLLQLHKASFIGWVVLMSLHVLTYVGRLPAQLAGDWRRQPAGRPAAGRVWRLTLVAASLIVGLVVALATLRLGASWLRPGRSG